MKMLISLIKLVENYVEWGLMGFQNQNSFIVQQTLPQQPKDSNKQ